MLTITPLVERQWKARFSLKERHNHSALTRLFTCSKSGAGIKPNGQKRSKSGGALPYQGGAVSPLALPSTLMHNGINPKSGTASIGTEGTGSVRSKGWQSHAARHRVDLAPSLERPSNEQNGSPSLENPSALSRSRDIP